MIKSNKFPTTFAINISVTSHTYQLWCTADFRLLLSSTEKLHAYPILGLISWRTNFGQRNIPHFRFGKANILLFSVNDGPGAFTVFAPSSKHIKINIKRQRVCCRRVWEIACEWTFKVDSNYRPVINIFQRLGCVIVFETRFQS